VNSFIAAGLNAAGSGSACGRGVTVPARGVNGAAFAACDEIVVLGADNVAGVNAGESTLKAFLDLYFRTVSFLAGPSFYGSSRKESMCLK